MLKSKKETPYSKVSQMEEGLNPVKPIVRAVITKETISSRVGILFREKPNGIMLKEISSGGLATNTELRPGMKLISVNGVDFQSRSSSVRVATQTIACIQGDVEIVAAEWFVVGAAAVVKDKLGISFDDDIEKQCVVIRSIESGSSLARSRLESGMPLLMINDVDCSKSTAREVNDLLSNLVDGSTVMFFAKGDQQSPTLDMNEDIPVVQAEMVPIRKVTTTVSNEEEPPPPGVGAGGVWGTNKYRGASTVRSGVLCCVFCGGAPALVVCLCPHDRRRAYMVGNRVYDDNGHFVGGPEQFERRRFDGNPVDWDTKIMSYIIASVLVIIVTALLVALQNQNNPGY